MKGSNILMITLPTNYLVKGVGVGLLIVFTCEPYVYVSSTLSIVRYRIVVSHFF